MMSAAEAVSIARSRSPLAADVEPVAKATGEQGRSRVGDDHAAAYLRTGEGAEWYVAQEHVPVDHRSCQAEPLGQHGRLVGPLAHHCDELTRLDRQTRAQVAQRRTGRR